MRQIAIPKNKNMELILLAILTSFLISCNPGKTSEEHKENIIYINLDAKKENISDFFAYSHFIALETNEEALIGNVDKIEFYKDYIYVLDSHQKKIFVFDNEGNFIFQIDRKGESPTEYISIEDFYINKETQRIYLYDGSAGYLLITDMKGTYESRVKVPRGYNFEKLANGNWLFYLANASKEESLHNFVWLNEDFKRVKEDFPFNEQLTGRRYVHDGIKSVFSKYNDELYILPLFSNTVYVYDSEKDQINLKYNIRYNINVDEQRMENEFKNYLAKIIDGEIPSLVNNFHRIDSTAIFRFSYKNHPLICLYNEKSKEVHLCRPSFHESGLLFSSPAIYSSDRGNSLIMNVVKGSMYSICKDQNSKDNTVIKEIEHKIGNVDDPNPILVFYELK